MNIVEIELSGLTPYENNPRRNEKAVEKVAASIEEFGFKVPLVIDRDGMIVTGHTRYKAAQLLGLTSVPCVIADDLTPEQIKAFRLADNRVGEIAEWDLDLLAAELQDISTLDMEDFAFDISTLDDGGAFFDRDKLDGAERQEGNEEYNEFLEKFEVKKTTDDCYTPPLVFDVVLDWAVEEYGIDKDKTVRPFYPGGDYQKYKYKKDAIVFDNPPFSILSEIVRFYTEKGIRFFIFAPALTMFSSAFASDCCGIGCGAQIIYENGASVSTSFLTNLEGLRFRSAPTLYRAIQKAVEQVRKEQTKEMPKYSYPDEVLTSAMLSYYSHNGIDFRATKEETEHIRELDAQKEVGKTVFGSGFLLSRTKAAEKAAAEKAAAEKAAAHRWLLSDRERAIVERLDHGQETMENQNKISDKEGRNLPAFF